MRKVLLLIALLSPVFVQASNLTTFWASDGYKLPRDICYPEGATSSTTTLSRMWNGHAITPFSAEGMTVGFEVMACDTGAVNASSVTVSMSSMTCTGGATIVSVPVSSGNVTDTSTRPQQVFSAWYVQHQGASVFPYGFSEYEERQFPLDMRVPCTVNVNGDCIPTTTPLWANRLYHDMYFPVAWVPEEEFLISSETVAAGNSKSWEVDTWVSSATLTANATLPGFCTGQFTILEGVSVSTTIPVFLKVYPVQMPVQPTLNTIVAMSNPTTDLYLNGNEFPGVDTGVYLQGHQNLAKLFKAHGLTVMGDVPDSTANFFPSAEYQAHVDATIPSFLYTPANGYGNARATGAPDPIYGVGGTYGQWRNVHCSTSTLFGTNSFSVCMSSWTAYCQTHNLPCFVSTYEDEGSSTNISGTINTVSTWLSTVTATGFNGQQLPFFQTQQLARSTQLAPYIGDNVSATNWDNTFPHLNIESNYQVTASSIMAGNGPAGTNGAIWRYNSGSIGFGATFAYDDAGEVPEADFLALWKKLCYDGKCHGGFYFYLGNGWLDSSAGNAHRDVYNKAITFGFDNFPSTSSQWGHHGFNYSEGDGVLAYPGRIDPAVGVSATPSFGFNGGIAGFTLKKIRDGINDADIASLAYAISPSATNAIISSLWPQALWEVPCFAPAGDCSFSYGDRSWAYGQDAYTMAREQLLQIVAGAPPPPAPGTSAALSGNATLKGSGQIQ